MTDLQIRIAHKITAVHAGIPFLYRTIISALTILAGIQFQIATILTIVATSGALLLPHNTTVMAQAALQGALMTALGALCLFALLATPAPRHTPSAKD